MLFRSVPATASPAARAAQGSALSARSPPIPATRPATPPILSDRRPTKGGSGERGDTAFAVPTQVVEKQSVESYLFDRSPRSPIGTVRPLTNRKWARVCPSGPGWEVRSRLRVGQGLRQRREPRLVRLPEELERDVVANRVQGAMLLDDGTVGLVTMQRLASRLKIRRVEGECAVDERRREWRRWEARSASSGAGGSV